MIKHKCPPGMAEVSKEEMEQIQNIVFGMHFILYLNLNLIVRT
jgi:hypothetical protein